MTFEIHNNAAQETTKQRKSRTISNQNYAFAIATQILDKTAFKSNYKHQFYLCFLPGKLNVRLTLYIITVVEYNTRNISLLHVYYYRIL